VVCNEAWNTGSLTKRVIRRRDQAMGRSYNVIQGNIGKEANADMPILATLRHAASEARRPRGEQRIRDELAKGTGIQKTASIVGVGCGTVQRIKRAMAA